jgi:pimeloyl-ACP methyl ester carboxylesterase
MDHTVSAINAWLGDHLATTGNELQQRMAFYKDNSPLPPERLPAPRARKICVLVHGLGCNESCWRFPDSGTDYGLLLEQRHGYLPLYLRFNTGLHVSTNGTLLSALLEQLITRHGGAVDELVLIGHSMGGLVLRSACHQGSVSCAGWVPLVRHVVYLGSPHLGAPLERTTNAATRLLSRFDTTATRVVRDLLNSRSSGVKDLRFGNLVDEDWRDDEPEGATCNRRTPVPWLTTARHHFVVGEATSRLGVLGDGMVPPSSASSCARGTLPGAPEGSSVQLISGLHHLQLAHHPEVYEHIERWVARDG